MFIVILSINYAFLLFIIHQNYPFNPNLLYLFFSLDIIFLILLLKKKESLEILNYKNKSKYYYLIY